jgi:hypothetical protein
MDNNSAIPFLTEGESGSAIRLDCDCDHHSPPSVCGKCDQSIRDMSILGVDATRVQQQERSKSRVETEQSLVLRMRQPPILIKIIFISIVELPDAFNFISHPGTVQEIQYGRKCLGGNKGYFDFCLDFALDGDFSEHWRYLWKMSL